LLISEATKVDNRIFVVDDTTPAALSGDFTIVIKRLGISKAFSFVLDKIIREIKFLENNKKFIFLLCKDYMQVF